MVNIFLFVWIQKYMTCENSHPDPESVVFSLILMKILVEVRNSGGRKKKKKFSKIPQIVN